MGTIHTMVPAKLRIPEKVNNFGLRSESDQVGYVIVGRRGSSGPRQALPVNNAKLHGTWTFFALALAKIWELPSPPLPAGCQLKEEPKSKRPL